MKRSISLPYFYGDRCGIGWCAIVSAVSGWMTSITTYSTNDRYGTFWPWAWWPRCWGFSKRKNGLVLRHRNVRSR